MTTPNTAAPDTQEPAWLAGADAEEREELAALGIDLSATTAATKELEAMASRVMRRLFEHEQDVERFNAAEQNEVGWIKSRYDAMRAPVQAQMKRLQFYLMLLISDPLITFAGKAKSRAVGWGRFGRRLSKQRVEITDEAAAINYLKANNMTDGAVVATISMPYNLFEQLNRLTTAVDFEATFKAAKFSLSKTDAGKAMDALKVDEIPGAKLIKAEDRPFYEIEVPPDFVQAK